MREETRRLFPLSTIGSVVQLFRNELTHSHHDPDIVLLSIVAGCIENSMTSPRTGAVSEVGIPSQIYSSDNLSRMATFSAPVSLILRSLR